MNVPQSLDLSPVSEVPLTDSPLVAVVAQVRFPTILTIRQANDAQVAALQARLRGIYPYLNEHHAYHFDVVEPSEPRVARAVVWRFSDRKQDPNWRISLGDDFVALEARNYTSRKDFLERLGVVLDAVCDVIEPASATRLGIRYVDRLTGNAVDRIDDLLIPEVLGVARRCDDHPNAIERSIVNLMTHAQLRGPRDAVVAVRWGVLPPSATHDPDMLPPVAETSWILDMDMFTTAPCDFSASGLSATAASFAEYLYSLFRQVVTDDFLEHYGGQL